MNRFYKFMCRYNVIFFPLKGGGGGLCDSQGPITLLLKNLKSHHFVIHSLVQNNMFWFSLILGFQICRIYRNCMIISSVRLFFTLTLTFYRWDYWQNPRVWIQDCSTKRNEFNPRAGRRVLCWAQRKGILWWFSGTHD